jgi:murein DD-endopeptidase MepM/ murein hydrolase activator NlpD
MIRWSAVSLSVAVLSGLLLTGCVNLQLGRSHAGASHYDASAVRYVRRGDTLAGISSQYRVSPDALARANNLPPGVEPTPGRLLRIPRVQMAAREARAWPHDTYLRHRGINPTAEASRIIGHAGAAVTQTVALSGRSGGTLARNILNRPTVGAGAGMVTPVIGKFGRGFNPAAGHKGVDILAPEGTPVRAARDGIVVYSDNQLSGYGNLVIIDHGNNLATVYGHNSVNLVRLGASVRRGTVIARVGQTGNASTPHLHFEVRRGQTPVDPLPYLR